MFQKIVEWGANIRLVNPVDVNASVHPVSLVNANIKIFFFMWFGNKLASIYIINVLLLLSF